MKRAKHYEFDVVPPAVPLVISLSLQPEEVEMAIATGGKSLQNSDHASAGRSADDLCRSADRAERQVGIDLPNRLAA